MGIAEQQINDLKAKLQAQVDSVAAEKAQYESVVEELQTQVQHWHDRCQELHGRVDEMDDTMNLFERPWSIAEASSRMVADFSNQVKAKAAADGVSTAGPAEAAAAPKGQVAGGVSAAGTSILGWGGCRASGVTAAGKGTPPFLSPSPLPNAPRRPALQNGPLEIATTIGEVIKLEGEYEQVVGGDEVITRREEGGQGRSAEVPVHHEP